MIAMMRTHTVAISLCLSAAAFFAGCSQGTNSRTTISQAETLPALTAHHRPLQEATSPSLDGLDRSHWEAQAVRVSTDGSRGFFWQQGLRARNGGDHPTAISALELAPEHTAGDIIGGWFATTGDGILLPFRSAHALQTNHPGEHADSYQRYRLASWRDGETSE